MAELAVIVAVQDAGKVLLTQREDFEIWCLPGGAIDPGESPAVAAVREVHEETGLTIQITRLVAIISRPNWGVAGRISFVFAANPIGGVLHPDPHEVINLGYFAFEQLPTPLFLHHERMLEAVAQGSVGQLWVSMHAMPRQFPDRAALYRWRDESGLPRAEAFAQIADQFETSDLVCVIP
jgi:8-oxo-dGTP pyrophosphatase MutT (NUDIX family)